MKLKMKKLDREGARIPDAPFDLPILEHLDKLFITASKKSKFKSIVSE